MTANARENESSWVPEGAGPAFDDAGLAAACARFREPLVIVRARDDGLAGVAFEADGHAVAGAHGRLRVLGRVPEIYPEWLGERAFAVEHGVRFPYVVGEMANGIATPQMVVEAARAGILAFYGAAGLDPGDVEAGVARIVRDLGREASFGANLIHSPQEPALEDAVADVYLRHGVRRVSASAFMSLSPAVVRYAASGLTRRADGAVVRANHVLAKVSRVEVARHFLSPPPARMLAELRDAGKITAEEAALAATLPVAGDCTVEADSGGHTDNRPLTAIFGGVLALARELAARHGYARAPRVGAAGGIGTPDAVAAAFGLGAAYVLTGSINQSAREAGVADDARELLAAAGVADVAMAPAADMFEMGVRVQVLKRGTLFASRARRLWELYRAYESLDAMPDGERERLEREILGQPIDAVWAETERFWSRRAPSEIERARADPRHRMALVMRWYLGRASGWTREGAHERVRDYQLWCGPAMGAFNEWVKGSFLAPASARGVVQIALNLLEGAAAITRAQQLRACGVAVPASAFQVPPRRLAVEPYGQRPATQRKSA